MNESPVVGLFDSGVGGMSVAREIRAALPHERLLYVADSAYCPYGERPLEEIRERSLIIAEGLLARGAKIVVVACNTASGAALELLRSHFSAPVVGLEPAVKPAAASSRNGRIAVLATPATLRSERFHRLVDHYGAGREIMKVACPGFVELVEAGRVSGPDVVAEVGEVLRAVREEGVDRVVLGCTHYPFLREVIAEVLGEGVEILDSGAAVARQVARVLAKRSLRAVSGEGSMEFLTTGDAERVGTVAERLWGRPLPTEHLDLPGSSAARPAP